MDSTRTRIERILDRMHSDHARALDISALAGEAGMSVCALHHPFKAITAT